MSETSSQERRYRGEKWLREQYIKKQRTSAEIADRCGCCASTIRNWLKKHGIETRDPSPTPEPLKDEGWLREQYVEKQKSTNDISDELECSSTTVNRWLRKHGIEVGNAHRTAPSEQLKDESWLREQYVEKQKSTNDIGSEIGCSPGAVNNWLRKHGIEVGDGYSTPGHLKDEAWLREQYSERERTTYEIAEECDCSPGAVNNWLRKHGIEVRESGRPLLEQLEDGEWLREQYVQKQRSTPDIADEIGCSQYAVWNRLQEHGIETRNIPSGPDHPNYNGGWFPYGPGWNPRKKREVRKRDQYRCQDPDCDVTQPEHRETYQEALHVHHIRKARKFDDPQKRNAPKNLIALCQDCHNKWEGAKNAPFATTGESDARKTQQSSLLSYCEWGEV